jgi:2-keto-4-pentenoate hydratase/2-oxohepta-3-ene-1,7-dioic acid hydratase in catechol pathway
MKLIRYGAPEAEKPGVQLPDGRRIDVSAFTPDFDEQFFVSGKIQELSAWVDANAAACPEIDPSERLGACIGRPSKLICIGLNYAKHAAESGMALPEEPVVFFKATTAICGPYDNLIIPKNSIKTDWEVELAVVIGKKASYVEEADAMEYVAGYVLHNDYSEREFQLERSGQWVKGKSADTFAPLGPFLATPDEISDPHNLRLWLSVNGEMVQDSNTDDLVFKIPHLIHYLSQFMTLLPGDVISTGTPFGVGLGFKPPRYLKPGDAIELGIDGLGVQKQVAQAWSAS